MRTRLQTFGATTAWPALALLPLLALSASPLAALAGWATLAPGRGGGRCSTSCFPCRADHRPGARRRRFHDPPAARRRRAARRAPRRAGRRAAAGCRTRHDRRDRGASPTRARRAPGRRDVAAVDLAAPLPPFPRRAASAAPGDRNRGVRTSLRLGVRRPVPAAAPLGRIVAADASSRRPYGNGSLTASVTVEQCGWPARRQADRPARHGARRRRPPAAVRVDELRVDGDGLALAASVARPHHGAGTAISIARGTDRFAPELARRRLCGPERRSSPGRARRGGVARGARRSCGRGCNSSSTRPPTSAALRARSSTST